MNVITTFFFVFGGALCTDLTWVIKNEMPKPKTRASEAIKMMNAACCPSDGGGSPGVAAVGMRKNEIKNAAAAMRKIIVPRIHHFLCKHKK